MEEGLIEESENSRETMEVSPALIAVHPLEKSVVVAIGSELRVFDLEGDCSISLVDDSGGPSHTDAIRAISFGAKGRLFASAGDDKLVKVWTTDSWHCKQTACSEKRVTAVAISHDGLFLTFSDKFGVVWIVCLDGDGESQNSVDKKAAPILAHYCSIITSLEFSPDGRFIASADRDFKIRVTVFPKNPLNGTHEIQNFCLGHTEFVSCLAFVCIPVHPQGLLLSGSGDSTVRMWDILSGCLLDTCEVGRKAGLVESNERDEECYPAITDLCASPDGSLVAVAIQSLHGIVLLSCDVSAGTLAVAKVVSVADNFIPTSLGISTSAKRLWMVTGASNLSCSTFPPLARVRVIASLQADSPDSDKHEPVVLEDEAVSGGEKLLEKLQGSATVEKEGEALAAAAEAVKMAMCNLLIKRQYSVEKREWRKKSRNDRKLKQ